MTATETSQNLAKEMCAQRSDVVTKTISFRDSDIPEYLEKLRRFEAASRKTQSQIIVK